VSRERWLVDDWELTQGYDRDVEYRRGLYRTPAAEGEDANVANRTGRLWRPKVHGPGSFVLALWFGSSISRAAVEAAWDEILRALVHPHRLSVYKRYLADGTMRQCQGDVVAALDPTPIGQLGMRCGVEVNVPSGYWAGATEQSQTVAMGASASTHNVDLTLSAFARSTAAMENLTFRITGPVSNPRVVDMTDGVEGESFSYVGSIPAGQTLVVNSGTWAVTGEGGFAPILSRLNHTGRRYCAVAPARPGQTPKVRFYGENVAAATALNVRGYEAFLL
jgi:hypothetical protein